MNSRDGHRHGSCMVGLADQSAASRSGCRLAGSCWRLMPLGGWPTRAMASEPVRPSSSAQLWMCGQRRCSSWMSCSPTMSARVMAVMAVLRSTCWPGSQDTSQPGWRSAACRAVWAVCHLATTKDPSPGNGNGLRRLSTDGYRTATSTRCASTSSRAATCAPRRVQESIRPSEWVATASRSPRCSHMAPCGGRRWVRAARR